MNLDDPRVKKALLSLQSSPNEAARHILKNYARIAEVISAGEEDNADLLAGDISLGYDDWGRRVAFRTGEGIKNVLILGNPDMGKTTLIIVMACGYLNASPHITCFMPTGPKGDEKSYIKYLHDAGMPAESMGYYSARPSRSENTLFLCFLQPPVVGMDIIEWFQIASGVFARCTGLRPESETVFLAADIRAWDELGRRRIPSLHEVHKALLRMMPKDRITADYFLRVHHRLDMIRQHFSAMYYCREGLSFERDIAPKRFVLFDTSQSDPLARSLITGISLAMVHVYARHKVPFETDTRLVLLLDEVWEIFGRDKLQGHVSTGILEEPLRTGRTRGIHIIMANQTFTDIAQTARTVLGALITMPINPAEVPAVSAALGLDRDQVDELKLLQKGQAFVKFFGRPGPAVKFECADLKVDHNIPEEEIRALCGHIPGDVKLSEPDESAVPAPSQPSKPAVDPSVQAFVTQAAKNFSGMMKDHAAALDITIKECSAVQTAAAEQGYVELFTAKLDDKPGAPAMYTSLTEAGHRLLVETGLLQEGQSVHPGKSGTLHALLGKAVTDKVGAKEGIECRLEDRGCDVGVYQNGEPRIAVEISHTTQVEHELHSIRRNFSHGWPRVITVVVVTERAGYATSINDEKSKNKRDALLTLIRQHLTEEEQKRVDVVAFCDFRRKTYVL